MKRPYQGHRFAIVSAVAACLALAACGHRSGGSVLPSSPSEMKSAAQTYSSGNVSMTVTPNFQSGFGTVRYGYQQTAQPGSAAQLHGGVVDFGDVEAGTDYLYKYALQVAVTAPSAFHLYAAATDFTGTATLSAAQRLYWLASSNQNTSFGSPSVPFSSSMESIYAGKRNATLSYDYILRLGNSDLPGVYSANVTYTVVAQ